MCIQIMNVLYLLLIDYFPLEMLLNGFDSNTKITLIIMVIVLVIVTMTKQSLAHIIVLVNSLVIQ